MTRYNYSTLLTWILIAVTVAGMGVMWIFTPESGDDYWLRNEWRSYVIGGCGDFEAVWRTVLNRATFDNVRLPNNLFIAQLPLRNEWLAGIFTTLFWALLLIYLKKIFEVRCLALPAIAVTIAGYLLKFPWHELAFSHVFAWNYIIPSGLSMMSVYYFIRIERYVGRGQLIWLFVLFFITGLSHESFFFPLFAAFFVYTVVYARRSLRHWLATLCFVPGILLFFTTAFAVRYASKGGIGVFGSRPLTGSFLLGLFLSIVVLLWIIWKRKPLDTTTRFLFLSAIIIPVGCIIRMAIPELFRAGWCAQLFTAPVLCILLFRRRNFQRTWTRIAVNLSAVVIGVCLCIHFVCTTLDTFTMRQWFYPALEKLKTSDRPQIFCKMAGLKDYHTYSLGRPFALFSIPGYTMQWLSIYYTDHATDYVFVPEELGDVDINPGRKVSGNNPFYEKDGYIYCDIDLAAGCSIADGKYWIVNGKESVGYEMRTFRTRQGAEYYIALATEVNKAKIHVMRMD